MTMNLFEITHPLGYNSKTFKRLLNNGTIRNDKDIEMLKKIYFCPIIELPLYINEEKFSEIIAKIFRGEKLD